MISTLNMQDKDIKVFFMYVYKNNWSKYLIYKYIEEGKINYNFSQIPYLNTKESPA